MHIFEFSLYGSLSLYVVLYQPIIGLFFAGFVALYVLISLFYPSSQTLSTRRKFTLATWSAPNQGLIYNNIPIRVDKLLAFLETIPKEIRPTVTHYVVRACGEILKQNPDLNGKLIFGKFVPYKTCDVSCLVNIDGGNDVGMMLVKNVPNKSMQDIVGEIKKAGERIHPKGGDSTHKKRMGLLNILPSFLIAILYKLSIFLTSHLGVNMPFMGLEKDSLGSIIVTSVGSFGYTDSYASFFGSTGQWMLMTVNAVHEQVIAVDGKMEVAQIMNVNCVIDHRYLYSGGRGKSMLPIFLEVFENP